MPSDLTLVMWSKGHMALRNGASDCISSTLSTLVSTGITRGDVIYLTCHATSYDHLTEWLWEILVLLLEVCHQPGKSCDHKHWDSQDIMFLICHLFKGLCEVMGGNFLRRVPTLPCLVAIGLMQVKILSILLKWPQKSMWLKDQVNWWVSAFHDVSTLPSLVVIGIVVAGRKCF